MYRPQNSVVPIIILISITTRKPTFCLEKVGFLHLFLRARVFSKEARLDTILLYGKKGEKFGDKE